MWRRENDSADFSAPQRLMSADIPINRGSSLDRPSRIFRVFPNGVLSKVYSSEEEARRDNSLSKIKLRRLIESGEVYESRYRFTDTEVTWLLAFYVRVIQFYFVVQFSPQPSLKLLWQVAAAHRMSPLSPGRKIIGFKESRNCCRES